jgi:hypothetical protein
MEKLISVLRNFKISLFQTIRVGAWSKLESDFLHTLFASKRYASLFIARAKRFVCAQAAVQMCLHSLDRDYRGGFVKNRILKFGFVMSMLVLSGCGGSGSGSADAPKTTPVTSTPVKSSTSVMNLEFAQTHVIPPAGLSWPKTVGSAPLILSGQRSALVLVQFTQTDIKNPMLEVWNNKNIVSTIRLNAPSNLPKTEGGDISYGSNVWSANIDANAVLPGMEVSFTADNYSRSNPVLVNVGANTDLKLQILPFVLFGATNLNTGLDLNFERTMHMTESMKLQLAAGWPASNTTIVNHPIGQFVTPFIVMPPRSGSPGRAAYIVRSAHEVDIGTLVSVVNDITYQLHLSSGDSSLNHVTFSSIIAIDTSKSSTNKSAWIGNGVSVTGSGESTGGNTFGFLLHESGHAMGLGHSNPESKDASGARFPYLNGSLSGSAWGYNSATNEFRSTLVPRTASIYTSCTNNTSYPKDKSGRCYRLDPMDNGDGGSAPNHSFSLFSDFNNARIQRWLQSRAKLDPASSTSFLAWNAASLSWKAYNPTTPFYGRDEIKNNLPVLRNVPLTRIVLTYSYAGTPNVSRFYPPMTVIDSSMENIDPTDPSQLAKIYPYTINRTNPEFMWYCHRSGCDYTVRVTYSDGTQAYRLLKGSFRKESDPATYDAGINDATNPKSFRMWSINIPRPANASVTRLELLDTPKVWNFSPEQIRDAAVLHTEAY